MWIALTFQNFLYDLRNVRSCRFWHMKLIIQFLGAFTKFRKKLLASLCLSVRVKQLGSHGMDFHEIWYLNIFQKNVEKFKFYWNLTGITGTLHEEQYTFMMISFSALLKRKNMPDEFLKNIKTHILCSITFFFRKCTVYEIMWKNTINPAGPK
jgi:hypothetical protein